MILVSLSLTAQEDFYWEDVQNIRSGNSFYPQSVSSGDDYILTVWQEYDRNDGEIVSLYASSSEDGVSWSRPFLLIEPFRYRSEDNVSLFSLSKDRNENPVLAITASEQEIDIYKLDALNQSMQKISSIESSYTSVVPRIFRKKNNDLILFMTGKVLLPGGTEALSIYFSESQNGTIWSEPEHFIQDTELKQNFLPYYSYDNAGEYVVFQSLFTGNRNSYQIYFKSKLNNQSLWSDEKLITGFSEYRNGEENEFFLFDNQRPHFFAENGSIHLVWERRLGREQPQVYYGVFDELGSKITEIEQVSRGSYFTAAPRVTREKDETLILWFDNRRGNQIIMAQFKGIFWQEKTLSPALGDSTYGRWIRHNDDLFVLWENQVNENRNIAIIAPDKSAPLPIVNTLNFNDQGRQSGSTVRLNWRKPDDSSGIRGFSYIWDKNPDTIPEKDLDFLDIRERTESFTALDDGDWYFHIALIDYAGNWSEPVHIRITRDTVPPEPVQFFKPITDAQGFLISNTFSLTWKSEDENLGGYSYRFIYLGEEIELMDPNLLDLPEPGDTVQITQSVVQYNNRDNGYWALAVCAFDDVGNKSPSNILLFRTNKYIPVTYISDVRSRKDDLERVVLTIIGRGFSARGNVDTVILDKDGKEPWDYEFTSEEFNVRTDRIIDGPVIEVFESGDFRVGVKHPLRGLAFARGRLRLESSGTVRFGDFSYDYKSFWTALDMAETVFSINKFAFYVLIFFLIFVVLVSSWQIYRIILESMKLEQDVKSIVEGTPFRKELQKERVKRMRQKGLGLRFKFTLALLTLILAVIMLISLFLGNQMINTQKENLSEGLYAKSSLLLETLATSARTYLPTQNRLELGILPGTIRAMDEALNTTITGQGASDPEQFNYIWSSNNKDIQKLQKYPKEVNPKSLSFPEDWSQGNITNFNNKYLNGEIYAFREFEENDRDMIYQVLDFSGVIKSIETGATQIQDEISSDILNLEIEINKRAAELIGDQNKQLDQLSEDAVRLALRGDTQSLEELRVIQETISRVETEINDKLATVSNIVKTYPEFTTEGLSDDQMVYTFYKPIVYRNKGRESYFRGMVRLDVSIESILTEIIATRKNIIQITLIIALIALAGGLVGALLLAQTMINPIRKLVEGVAHVRDTQDKSKLKNYVIETGTKDELAELASTFNQMTEGLVVAAAANKELILGKEIQKKFIPLETLDVGDRKLSTGEEENEHAHFFGYYEGAKGVSGDYFDFRKLDDKHYAVIKCDISGKGISAALIMVEVATIFIDFFSKLNVKRDGIHLDKLVYSINDLLENVGFKGRFAAFIITVINIETGKCWMCHAGDKNVYYYDYQQKKVLMKELNESPAAGVFPSIMVEGEQSFKQVTHTLKQGDILFLFTDGIEEAQRHFRDSNYDVVNCEGDCDPDVFGEGYESHKQNEDFEELGIPRMEEIIECVLSRKNYELFQYHQPNPDIKISFDFSRSSGTMKEAVLALISVEKVFRLVPDPKAGPDDRIRIDNKIDDYLKEHFDQYRDYFKYPIPDEEYPEYTYYSHLKEDEQFDDLTILGIKKK